MVENEWHLIVLEDLGVSVPEETETEAAEGGDN